MGRRPARRGRGLGWPQVSQMTKTCSKCGVEKHVNCFRTDSRSLKARSWCKSCDAQASLKWRENNRERSLENSRRYYAENRDKMREYARQQYRDCSEKWREIHRRWKSNNREKMRDSRRISKYGTDGHELFNLQAGRCAICNRRISISGNRSGDSGHLDHCSVTGIVRGWLCGDCNPALGKFNHDPHTLRKAAEYLERTVIFE